MIAVCRELGGWLLTVKPRLSPLDDLIREVNLLWIPDICSQGGVSTGRKKSSKDLKWTAVCLPQMKEAASVSQVFCSLLDFPGTMLSAFVWWVREKQSTVIPGGVRPVKGPTSRDKPSEHQQSDERPPTTSVNKIYKRKAQRWFSSAFFKASIPSMKNL